MVLPDVGKNMGHSKKLFATAMFAILMSRDVDRQFRKIAKYVSGTLQEMQLMVREVRSIMLILTNRPYLEKSGSSGDTQ